MRKHLSQCLVWLVGSRITIKRTVYTNGGTYFIKFDGELIEVTNEFTNVTNGWRTVKSY